MSKSEAAVADRARDAAAANKFGFDAFLFEAKPAPVQEVLETVPRPSTRDPSSSGGTVATAEPVQSRAVADAAILASMQPAPPPAAVRELEEQLRTNTELRTTIQSLESYIDARHAAWAALQKELADLRVRLATRDHEMAEKDSQLRAQAVASTELRAEIAELERRSEELATERTRLEAAGEARHTQATAEATSAATLRSDLAAARQRLDNTVAKLAAETAAAAQLRSELSDVRNSAAAAVAERSAEAATNAQLRADLATAVQRADGAAAQLAADASAAAQQKADLTEAVKRAEEAVAELARRGEQVSALETVAAEREQTLAELAVALDERRGAEIELHGARDALAARMAQLEQTMAEHAKEVESMSARLALADSLLRDSNRQVSQLKRHNRVVADARPSGRRHRMIVAMSGELGVSYALTKDDATIGRDDDCDIHIRCQYLSRKHARFFVRNGTSFIEDLGSRNGVRVNSVSVEKRAAALSDGDILTIGGLEFRYIDVEERAGSGERPAAVPVEDSIDELQLPVDADGAPVPTH